MAQVFAIIDKQTTNVAVGMKGVVMKIVILDGYTLNPGDLSWDHFSAYGELTIYNRTNPEQVVERAKDAQIIVLNKVSITAKMLEHLPHLKCILVLATGYDCVDVAEASSKGIVVSNVPIYGTESVAQFVMALILELSRQPALHDACVKRGEWMTSPDWCFWKKPLIELSEKNIGIVGFGRIGRRVGELAHAFKMNILANDIYEDNPPSYREFSWVTLEEIFKFSDYITLHCNQTRENIELVNADLIRHMKKSAFLINTSRGGLIKEKDLAAALDSEFIAGAAVDVVSTEPINANNPLLKAKNIIITPHISWATLEARQRLMTISAENLKAFIDGHPKNIVK